MLFTPKTSIMTKRLSVEGTIHPSTNLATGPHAGARKSTSGKKSMVIDGWGCLVEIPCDRRIHLGTILSLYTQLSALFTPLPWGPFSPPLYEAKAEARRISEARGQTRTGKKDRRHERTTSVQDGREKAGIGIPERNDNHRRSYSHIHWLACKRGLALAQSEGCQ